MRGPALPIVVAVAFAPLLCGQITRIGAEVFAKNCANQYCHGAAGERGAAPALIGRGLTLEQLTRAIREGVPNTNMAGWEESLLIAEVEAVISFVRSIQRAQGAGQPAKLDPGRAWLQHPGRDLFFDAARTTPCGSCHAFDGLGLAVAPPFSAAPRLTIAGLRALESDKVVALTPRAEPPFPAIRASEKAGASRWYDLSAQLPVLRIFKPDQFSTTEGASWSHRDAIESYEDSELGSILEFLREALAR